MVQSCQESRNNLLGTGQPELVGRLGMQKERGAESQEVGESAGHCRWGLGCSVPTSGQSWRTVLWGTGEMKLMGGYTEGAGLPLWTLLGPGPRGASLYRNLAHLCIWLGTEQLSPTQQDKAWASCSLDSQLDESQHAHTEQQPGLQWRLCCLELPATLTYKIWRKHTEKLHATGLEQWKRKHALQATKRNPSFSFKCFSLQWPLWQSSVPNVKGKIFTGPRPIQTG